MGPDYELRFDFAMGQDTIINQTQFITTKP